MNKQGPAVARLPAFVVQTRSLRDHLPMAFDPRTAILLACLITALLALSVAATVREYRGGLRTAVSIWAAAIGLQCGGWLMLGLRGEIPLIVSSLGGNLLILTGSGLLSVALMAYFEQPLRLAWLAWIVVISALALAWYTINEDDAYGRVITASVAIFSVNAIATWTTVTGPGPFSAGRRILVVVLCSACLVLAVRIGWMMSVPAQAGIFDPTPINAIVFSLGAYSPVLATVSFLLMVNRRIQLQWMATAATDWLTELPNRREFETATRRMLAIGERSGQPVSLLLIDVDHFKSVNDNYGHAAGDRVLQALAQVLRQQLRATDVVARIGGEEFALTAPATSASGALTLAELLRQRLKHAAIRATSKAPEVTVTIGIAQSEAGDDPSTLLRRADRRLYEGKAAGRNCIVAADGRVVRNASPEAVP